MKTWLKITLACIITALLVGSLMYVILRYNKPLLSNQKICYLNDIVGKQDDLIDGLYDYVEVLDTSFHRNWEPSLDIQLAKRCSWEENQ